MSLNDFITNLSGLCDGGDFPKEHLKVSILYPSNNSTNTFYAVTSKLFMVNVIQIVPKVLWFYDII